LFHHKPLLIFDNIKDFKKQIRNRYALDLLIKVLPLWNQSLAAVTCSGRKFISARLHGITVTGLVIFTRKKIIPHTKSNIKNDVLLSDTESEKSLLVRLLGDGATNAQQKSDKQGVTKEKWMD
jgi:hypothetical protein